MGQNSSKGKQQSLLGNKISDDGCIGNRKVRTITLSLLLIAFFAFGLSLFLNYHDDFDNPNIFTLGLCTIAGDAHCNNAASCWILVTTGACVVIVSAICAILLFFMNCGDNVGRVAGVGLIVGGILYLCGWSWFIKIYLDLFDAIPDVPDDVQHNINAQMASWFGEAFLPSATAVLLGVDVFMHMFDKESHRLLSNLLILFIVAGMCCTTYYDNSNISDDDSTPGLVQSDSFGWIATGYAIIWFITLLYIILYIFTCCTCDCKDTACARLIHSVFLIIGGVLTTIGYYYYASDLNNSESMTEGLNDDTVAYYVGYTVLIGGGCLVWAFDIGLDDVKSMKT